jgi:hypothetical protein
LSQGCPGRGGEGELITLVPGKRNFVQLAHENFTNPLEAPRKKVVVIIIIIIIIIFKKCN